jgi:hypothetical protein
MCTVRKGRTLLDEVVDPRCVEWVRKVDVFRLTQGVAAAACATFALWTPPGEICTALLRSNPQALQIAALQTAQTLQIELIW